MRSRLCAIAFCLQLAACSRAVPNAFEIIGCRDDSNKAMYGSGMTKCGSDIYIVSDQCPVMQRYQPRTDMLSDIPMSGLHAGARLKGVASFGGELYAIDTRNEVIYRFDSLGVVKATLPVGISKPEGISINAQHQVMYVMQPHRTLRKMTRIYTYGLKLDDGGNIVGLSKDEYKVVTISRELRQLFSKPRFKYTDISFDDDRKRIVLLRTRSNTHVIEEIEVNRLTGVPVPGLFREVMDVSREVGACDGYTGKMEGVVVDGYDYYLVGNGIGVNSCKGDSKARPLLMRLRIWNVKVLSLE